MATTAPGASPLVRAGATEPKPERRPATKGPQLTISTTGDAGPDGGKPKLGLMVDTGDMPISPSVASMMKGMAVPLSPSNRKRSLMGGPQQEWKLDSPRSPLFLRRRSANGSLSQPAVTLLIPAADEAGPCCPSPLCEEERSTTPSGRSPRQLVHPDDDERATDQQEKPAEIVRKRSFMGAGMAPGPY